MSLPHPAAPTPGAGAPAGLPGNAEVLRELRSEIWSRARIEQEAGLKPVRKIEALDAAHVGLCRRHPGLFCNLQVLRRPAGSAIQGCEVFFGADRDAAAEAASLTARLQGSRSLPAREFERTVGRIGVLLGYPRCCSRAYAAQTRAFGDSNERLWVARRIAAPGRISGELGPFTMPYVPCSMTCPASLARARRVLQIMAARYGPDYAEAERRFQETPALMLLDVAGQSARIHPVTPVSRRFRYRAADAVGGDPRWLRVAQGDEMLLEPGRITILRSGAEHAVFPADAFLWWDRKAFYAGSWRRCLAARNTARA